MASTVIVGFWIVHGLVVDEWNLTRIPGIMGLDDQSHRRRGTDRRVGVQSIGRIWTTLAVQGLIAAGLMFGLWLRFRTLREGRS